MNVLITAGGTSEYIDSVRKITNSSTGRLGAYIYTSFQKSSIENLYIHYVASEDAILPQNINKNNTTLYQIKDTKSLEGLIINLSETVDFQIAIHLMAVSDFYVNQVESVDNFLNQIVVESDKVKEEEIRNTIRNLNMKLKMKALFNRRKVYSAEKLSSKDDLILVLKKTPKIISLIREYNQDCKLIGFKLLNDVSQDELIEVASNLCDLYQCEFVVGNDMKNIIKDRHQAIFVKNRKAFKSFETKEEIAEGIINYFIESIAN